MSRSRAQGREARVARLGHAQHRARLRVRLGKPQEIVRQRLRQDHQVGLHIARRQARRRAGERARADAQPLRATQRKSPIRQRVHHNLHPTQRRDDTRRRVAWQSSRKSIRAAPALRPLWNDGYRCRSDHPARRGMAGGVPAPSPDPFNGSMASSSLRRTVYHLSDWKHWARSGNSPSPPVRRPGRAGMPDPSAARRQSRDRRPAVRP